MKKDAVIYTKADAIGLLARQGLVDVGDDIFYDWFVDIGEDGEDITCFFHHSLDCHISTLIAARTHMALGEVIDKKVSLSV